MLLPRRRRHYMPILIAQLPADIARRLRCQPRKMSVLYVYAKLHVLLGYPLLAELVDLSLKKEIVALEPFNERMFIYSLSV